MKTLFGMTAAVLLFVSMLFVSLPGTARAAGKVTLAEMVNIKKAADEAAQVAKAQVEKAKTAEEKRLAKQLVKQAKINAEVAGDLLEAVKAGEEVSREEAEACAAIAKAVHEATGALAAGNTGKAEGAMGRVAELGSNLPTAANASAEISRDNNRSRQNQTFPGTTCRLGIDVTNSWPVDQPTCKDRKSICQDFNNVECVDIGNGIGMWVAHNSDNKCTPCVSGTCTNGACTPPVCTFGRCGKCKKCKEILDGNGTGMSSYTCVIDDSQNPGHCKICISGEVVDGPCKASPSSPDDCPCVQ